MVSLKMQATASNKGFTLVELIVVITILAILGTIGFISLQGYSAQSRDAKRVSELRTLSSTISAKSTEGIALTNFADGASKLTAGTVAGLDLNLATDYNAGLPNFTVLGIAPDSFKDGANDYRIGATWRAGGVFQVAAKLENSGTPITSLVGNYNPRAATSHTGAGTASTTTAFNVAVGAESIGGLKAGDQIYVVAATPWIGRITSVSPEGTSVVITGTGASGVVTSIILGSIVGGNNDSSGLIGKVGALGTAISNNSTTDLPY